MQADSLAQHIWSRQYAIRPEETMDDGFRRVAEVIASAELVYANSSMSAEEAKQRFYDLMASGRFVPGGRILAGAGTKHGNILNCFVLSGNGKPGTTDWALSVALKLALVTKVGGGTGVNLDPITAKKPYQGKVGQLYLYIDTSHPDYEDVQHGRITSFTGKKEERGYKAALCTDNPVSSYYVKVQDSIRGIWQAASLAVKVLLEGENVTVDLTGLRPEGKPVQGSGGTSSGPASFAVEIFDNFARWAALGGAEYAGPVATLRYLFAPTLRVIRQGGTRRGAGMATLSVWHPDIYDFITAKDLEREAAEGDISTYNISVLADQLFMGLVDGQWPEVEEDRNEAIRRFNAIAEHAHATGEPGLIFVDTINRHNPLVEVDGPITATNPCGEIPLYAGEPCDLGALNLAEFVHGGQVNFEALAEAARLSVRFLDNVLTVENSPLSEIGEAIEDKRRIGLGVMGLADMLIKLGLEYDSEEARTAVRRVMSTIVEAGLETSKKLGLELGVPAGVLRAGLQRRNIALFTVAPTGTTSMLAGVSSGIEPVFAAVYQRRIGTEVKDVVHSLLLELLEESRAKEWLNNSTSPLALWQEDKGWTWNISLLVQALNKTKGSVQPLVQRGWLPPWFSVFQTAHDLTPEAHVLMQAAVQEALDYHLSFTHSGLTEGGVVREALTLAGNSISKTINLPHEASVEDVRQAYVLAHSKGLKGCTVYRDGSRGYQVLSAGKGDFEAWAKEHESKNEVVKPDDKTEVNLFGPSAYYAANLRVRESVIDSRTHKYDVGGRKVYVTVGWNQKKEVVECFITLSKPTPNEAVAVDIVGRLISLAFKYGASVNDVAKHLEGHFDQSGGLAERLGFVNSVWDVVASTLRQYCFGPTGPKQKEAVGEQPKGDCPECGQGTLVRKGGCNKCDHCGYETCG